MIRSMLLLPLRRWRRRREAVLRTGTFMVVTVVLVMWWSKGKGWKPDPDLTLDEDEAQETGEKEAMIREQRAVDEILKEAAGRMVVGAGEHGMAVTLPPGSERDQAMKMISTEAFNVIVSNMIAYNRSIPDNRHSKCHEVVYDKLLPNASIVIIFTNEAWSALIRTVHSVINRTPAHLLHEIILYDDFSDRPVLKKPLERYIALNFPNKVTLLRASRRLGLIRARLEGAKAATGEAVVFLDSHCECNVGWLEPLVQRIKENRKVAAVPIIEVIDDKTLQYMGGSSSFFQVGSFTWSGHFTWINIPEKEANRRESAISPTRSATMAGGLFAMDRNYFWEIGGYDDGMDIWGGENLEMSFRVWMCGGSLETIPCSRVGHIFRSFHPYTFPDDKDTHGINTVRMAEVWMDDHKRLFYLYRPDLKKVDYGDISARKHLRRKLGCKSFQWFLENIAHDKFILDDDSLAYGRFFALSMTHQLRREATCAEVTESSEASEVVHMNQCVVDDKNQEWILTPKKQLKHVSSGRCLDSFNTTAMDTVHVTTCKDLPSQMWAFDKYNVAV